MGFALFTASTTFNPINFGLSPGDQLQVICVGGGGGGGAWGYTADGASDTSAIHGGTGGTSSFGSYVSALGGMCRSLGTQGQFMGQAPTSTSYTGFGGGGAGGWIPGTQWWGGDGEDLAPIAPETGTVYTYTPLYSLAGYTPFVLSSEFSCILNNLYPTLQLRRLPSVTHSRIYSNQERYAFTVMDAQQLGGGRGTSIASTSSSGSAGLSTLEYALFHGVSGAGYGAGGAGASGFRSCSTSSSYSRYAWGGAGYGGNSGEVRYASVILSSTSAIPISVGGGGSGARSCNGTYNSSSSTYYYANNTTGKNGTTSGGGAKTGTSLDNSGGYGTNPNGGDAYGSPAGTGSISTSTFSYTGGALGAGGASGCVVVFW